MIQFADDCLVIASNKDEKIAKIPRVKYTKFSNLLQRTSIEFKFFQFEFVCFSKQKDQKNKIQDTILVDNKVIKKSNECKCLELTIHSSLSFVNNVKHTLMVTAQDKKTLGYIVPQLPTSSLEILIRSIVLSHLNYTATFI